MKSIFKFKTMIVLALCFNLNSCFNLQDSSVKELGEQDLEKYEIRWLPNALPLKIYMDSHLDIMDQDVTRFAIESWNDIEGLPENIKFFNIAEFSIPDRYMFSTNILNPGQKPYPYDDDLLGVYKIENWFQDSSKDALALTYFWLKKRETFYQMVGADILLNWEFFQNSDYDLYSVILHEAGHMLGLKHATDSDQIMFPTLGQGQVKRELHSRDIYNLLSLYRLTPETQEKKTENRIPNDMPDEIHGYFLLKKDGTHSPAVFGY